MNAWTRSPACVLLHRHKYTWIFWSLLPCMISPGAVSLMMFRVWALQRQLRSRGDVSHVRLCARQTPMRKKGGGGGCGGGGGVGVLHCSWSEAKTKSAILWWFCLSSVVFTQWLSAFLGVMEYLITPLKAFCPSTCSKICTHALQTVETQSCVLADTLVFSHFSQRHQNCTCTFGAAGGWGRRY